MEYSAVEAQVKKIIAEKLNIDTNRVTLDSRLVDDLAMDSFGSIEMAFELEEKFNIKIPDADIAQVKIVKDIVDYVAARAA
jgi:acyl carrier protein